MTESLHYFLRLLVQNIGCKFDNDPEKMEKWYIMWLILDFYELDFFMRFYLVSTYIQHIQSRILWNALMKILFIAIQNQLSRFFSSSNIMSFCIKRKGREFFITSEICKRSKHFFEGHAVRDQIDNYKYVKLMSFWLSFQRSQFFDVQR